VTALLLAALLATPATDLKRAKDRYEFGAWADAAGAVRQVFAQYPDLPEAQAVEAWRILGLAEYQLGDQSAARDAFIQLLSVNPDYALDPFLVPPNIVDFFDRVKRGRGRSSSGSRSASPRRPAGSCSPRRPPGRGRRPSSSSSRSGSTPSTSSPSAPASSRTAT